MNSVIKNEAIAERIEQVLVGGDLSKLSADERLGYYRMVCESIGLNPLTKPFEFITLNGKLTLYARKDATDQLRNIHQTSVVIIAREVVEGCYVVTAQAKLPSGRTDESIGAVPIENLKGEAKCNAMMKAETKAKRRVTLSISGLGMLDETEIETIPGAVVGEAPKVTAEVRTFGKPKADPAPAASPYSLNPELETFNEKFPPVTGKAPDAIEYVNQGQIANFCKSFRAALDPALQPKAEEYRHKFLAREGWIDADGNPSAKVIRAIEFESVKREAVEFAKVQPPF